MSVKCFLVTPTDQAWRSLRRYWGDNDCSGSYHNAHTPIGIVTRVRNADGYFTAAPAPDPAETRWPTACEKCGAAVPDYAQKQVFDDSIWIDNAGHSYSLRKPVPGMMWDAWWMGDWCAGSDGKHLVVVCPDGGEWTIDGRASNCTMPDDNVHRCWVRHGEPPDLIVDKNGVTCGAGAGSIVSRNGYHGFLGCQGAAPGYFT